MRRARIQSGRQQGPAEISGINKGLIAAAKGECMEREANFVYRKCCQSRAGVDDEVKLLGWTADADFGGKIAARCEGSNELHKSQRLRQ